MADAINYMKHYPLDQFLSIHYPRNFRCPFHEDASPSASIYQSAATGDYLLHCNGACDDTWDIIGVVMRSLGISYLAALKALSYVFNITVLHSEPQTSLYENRLKENLATIDTLASDPRLHKLLDGNYTSISPLQILQHMTIYALDLHQRRQDVRTPDGYPIFFVSARELMRQLTQDDTADTVSGSLSAKLTLLCYLGLLERVPDKDLSQKAAAIAAMPEHDYRGSNPERFKNSRGNRISFYKIPHYNADAVANALNMAQRWTDLGYSIRNLSYNKILATEGEAVAKRLYAGRKILQREKITPPKH